MTAPPPDDAASAERAEGQAYRVLSGHIENTPLAVIEWDAAFRIVRWSGQAERMFGWAAAEVVGRHPRELRWVHDDDVDRVGHVMGELLDAANVRNVCVNRNYRKDGRVVHCEWHNSAVADGGGRLASILSLVQDLTAARTAEAELRRSEDRMARALRHARMMVWDFDVATGDVYYSRHYGEFFGQPELGANPGPRADLPTAHPDERAAKVAELTRAGADRRDFRIEYRGAAPADDGGPRWFVARGQYVRDADGDVVRVAGIVADVTDRKRDEAERAALDRELHEARRYESLGVLAGGIAHDFNNLLTVIQGNAAVGRRAGGDAGGHFAAIEGACGRAADLCRQMTAYAGVGRFATVGVDLGELVRQAEPSYRREAAGRAAVSVRAAGGLPAVVGEPLQLRQAVLNLVVNAVEAGGGQVAVRVDGCAAADGGRGVRVAVTDDGCGMTAEQAAKAADPFYSTKVGGRGLGLAAAAGIVRGHGGTLRIDSREGIGTTVELVFPVDRGATSDPDISLPPVDELAALTPAARPGTAAGVVLVVDDEVNIRELIASLLEDDGYTVEVAGDGREAVDRFAAAPARYALAVVDVMMPGLNGHEVVRGLRAARPNLPVVLVSGFADRELPADLRAGGPTALLPKPFRVEALAAIVGEALRA